ncbi:MAG TPA: hypothetical protein VEA18_00235 [Candidatus Kapabacteria bacterium]|nr:hypothetical protein [Candidatus Kapabacteria bacterium]
MIDKKHISTLRTYFLSHAEKRRDVIKLSEDALHHAKRAIFAIHRHDQGEAEKKLEEATMLLKTVQKKYVKEKELLDEGAYKAALEEWVEATLLHQFVTKGRIGSIATFVVPPEQYVAGLCDVPGELYRLAVQAATKKDMVMVKSCAEMGEEVIGALIEFNLTSYLRNKFDQAKQAVQKLEQIVYDMSIRS